MSLKDKEKWDKKYDVPEYVTGEEPSEWLLANAGLLQGGRGLDIATGEGRNAVFAATLGYDMLAIDISEAGLKKARALAEKKRTRIATHLVDLDDYRFEEQTFDLILCFNFLDRKLFPAIRRALQPGGWIVYETFNVDYLKYSNFKREWVLEYNELLREFSQFRVFRYREVDRNEKAFSSLVARKGTE